MLSRREMLRRATLGFGGLAAAELLCRASMASDSTDSLRPRFGQFFPRAKRVIFIFLDGGVSSIDTYDYKPRLAIDDGKPLPASIARPKFAFAPTGQILKSPFDWKQWGERGMWASDLFPNVNALIDQLCFVHSLHHDNEDHFTAKNMLATGSGRERRPAIGSWVAYGLGTENQNLPAFVEVMPGVPKSTSSAFLPARYASTAIGRADDKARDRSWENLVGGKQDSPVADRLALTRLIDASRPSPAIARAQDADLENMELAFRMQTEAPEVMSLAGESAATLALYGVGEPKTDDFGRAALLARRLAERGVRYITLMHSTRQFGNLWDQHKDLYDGHRNNAQAVDQPIAGLLRDLQSRGMLSDTLVICGSEFGRTPVFEYQDGNEGRLRNGRDHNPHGFTMWFAGGGVRPGFNYGATDDFGYYAIEQKVTIPDLHATLLYALGIDHEKLTYRYGGRDYRLTDVSGRVCPIFA